MTDEDLTRIYGLRRTPAKPRTWWRRAWAALVRLVPFCDGDPVYSRREK